MPPARPGDDFRRTSSVRVKVSLCEVKQKTLPIKGKCSFVDLVCYRWGISSGVKNILLSGTAREHILKVIEKK
jgi:hypothetical protein